MKTFTELYEALDSSTSTRRKIEAMAEYFRQAPPSDAAWAVHFLSGERPKRLVPTSRLREWAADTAGLPPWILEESYSAVGDLAETLALLLAGASSPSDGSLTHWVEECLLPLKGLPEEEQRQAVVRAWSELSSAQIFLWNKLMTGGFRVGVSRRLVVRALEQVSGIDRAALSHRLMGHWQPSAESFEALLSTNLEDASGSRPYPFFLAHPLEGSPEDLGAMAEWQIEWKWDGIRGQLIRRQGETWLWSRGEELVTERFPEISQAAAHLEDGTVLDGEILPWQEGAPLPFGQLQRRIGRKRVGPKILREVPVVLLVYDLLESSREDLRKHPLRERRKLLESLLEALPGEAQERLLLSQEIPSESWPQAALAREQARQERAEGLMLKRRDSPYRVGRPRGDWWKWKVDPYSIDAVLLYAQRGHGRRASLYTDYTFGVWDGESLVPFAKAYSGLSNAEIRKVDRFVRRNTLERFGPVRSVEPELVFELHFEGLQPSSRHKSGIAVRFPRMARWRQDKSASEADTLETVRGLLETQ